MDTLLSSPDLISYSKDWKGIIEYWLSAITWWSVLALSWVALIERLSGYQILPEVAYKRKIGGHIIQTSNNSHYLNTGMSDTQQFVDEPNNTSKEVTVVDAVVDTEANTPAGTAEEEISYTAEEQQRLDALIEKFGEENITELMVETEFGGKGTADFLLKAAGPLEQLNRQFNEKLRFYLHREPNGEIYILRSVKPSEFKSQWIEVFAGKEGAFDMYAEQILGTTMAYPAYHQTDWEYDDPNKINAPVGLTKPRIIQTFFMNEMPMQEMPSFAFKPEDIENAIEVAKSNKVSL